MFAVGKASCVATRFHGGLRTATRRDATRVWKIKMTSSVIKRDAENGMERNTSGAYSGDSQIVLAACASVVS